MPPNKINQPQRMTVGRGIRELPEVHHQNYITRQAKRHAAEREAAAEEAKAKNAEVAHLENELHRSNIETIIIKRAAAARRSEGETKKLCLAVERARQAWCIAGRQGLFPVYDVAKQAEHELFGGVSPAPKGASPTDPLLNLPPPRNAEEARAQHELRMQAAEKARRTLQEVPDAYARLGLQNPAHGQQGTGRAY
jgi:hypothetical protein